MDAFIFQLLYSVALTTKHRNLKKICLLNRFTKSVKIRV